MKLNVRQQKILNWLQERQRLEIDHLAEGFAVSSQTIRKDINQLCEQGLARRLHGGVSLPTEGRNLSFTSRHVTHAAEKQSMARFLATQIPPGASIFLGIGTSVSHAAHQLLDHKGLRVVTNNLDVAGILCDEPDIEVLVAGGQLRHNDRDTVGESVTRFFDQFQVDVGVIGSGALHPQLGLLDFDPLEADISRAVLRNSRRSILLADQSKWQRQADVKVAPFQAIDQLITDTLPDTCRTVLEASGVVWFESAKQE